MGSVEAPLSRNFEDDLAHQPVRMLASSVSVWEQDLREHLVSAGPRATPKVFGCMQLGTRVRDDRDTCSDAHDTHGDAVVDASRRGTLRAAVVAWRASFR